MQNLAKNPQVLGKLGFGTDCHWAVRLFAGSKTKPGPQFRFQPIWRPGDLELLPKLHTVLSS